MDDDTRNRCPMCGREFADDEVKDARDKYLRLKCPRCGEDWAFDQLIGEWDDCAWDI
jgi:DNA-directed RNA polymerase subunit RPC12/RpoP